MTAADLSPPQHIAIIMDGNGRWAKQRNRPRTFGHREGVEALKRTVEAAGDLGVRYLTVFGFSTENWTRPPDEVSALLDLLRIYVGRDLERLAKEGVRVRIIGERAGLSADLLEIIERAERRTRDNDNLHLTIAFNYGGHNEIARAAKKLAQDVKDGRLAPEEVTPARFQSYLDTHGLPDPDVIVRTSGEQRVSNFLLWQSAYAEFIFTETLWPDFGEAALRDVIAQYHGRDRRFGGLADTAT
ncbi:MAG: isoprenyl transferase [Hyphomonadaceae bacterium]|nr:isoprenyl transferase [Hyphomonadaceae bacterium]